MVEKAQPPSGCIHWAVAVIPLGCVIVVLLCVIGFLLWRLKQATRNQNVEVTVNAIHHGVHTKSILNPGDGVQNKRANHTRVHFQEPNKYEDPKCLEPVTDNAPGCKEYVALSKKADHQISRRLAIRKKNSKELEGKYPLNKNGEDVKNETGLEELCGDTSDPNSSTNQSCVAEYACAKTDEATESEGPRQTDIPAGVNCCNGELPYLEIIQE